MPEWRQRLELGSTQRLIETGDGPQHDTLSARLTMPTRRRPTSGELAPLAFAERELGYTVVLERIDPQDWARPGADVIVQRVKEQRRDGSIICSTTPAATARRRSPRCRASSTGWPSAAIPWCR
jgi:hypothetical protein